MYGYVRARVPFVYVYLRSAIYVFGEFQNVWAFWTRHNWDEIGYNSRGVGILHHLESSGWVVAGEIALVKGSERAMSRFGYKC